MRRSVLACRGAKGYSWYNKFQEKGADGFRKFQPPTPFDWAAPIDTEATGVVTRPRVFFDVHQDKEPLGRVVFELAADVVPRTCHNFMRLVEGRTEKEGVQGYTGTNFHVVAKNNVIMGGDVENHDGTGNHSSYGHRYIADENFIIPHSDKGLLSMASIGRDTGASQFYIGLNSGDKNRHLNGRCVVFGRVVAGEDTLDKVNELFTTRLKPVHPVTIAACGVLEA
jgi:cyclophilin family peptidyl-prolyl cis-trans isomerase